MRSTDITSWEAFFYVAKYGSFSKAARALKETVPQISKRVAKLESHLGVRLFRRSTRLVTLTDEGKALLPRIESLLTDISSLESTFADKQKLAGPIRITSLHFIAQHFLAPILEKFLVTHPEVHVDLDLTERMVNLVEANIDLALRVHHDPPDSDLIYKKLIPNEVVLCASPEYLKKSRIPLNCREDLRAHNMLILDIHQKHKFKEDGLQLQEFTSIRRVRAQSGGFLTDLAVKNFGILLRSYWDIKDHLNSGRLVPVLPQYPLEDYGYIYAVLPGSRFLAPRVRALADAIVAQAEYWRKQRSAFHHSNKSQ